MAKEEAAGRSFKVFRIKRLLKSRDQQSDFVVKLALEVSPHFRKPDMAFLIEDDLRRVAFGIGQFIVSQSLNGPVY